MLLRSVHGRGPGNSAYHGRDRRGLVVETGQPRGLAGSLLVVGVSLAGGLVTLAALRTPPGPVVAGATEVAFIGFLATSGLLLLHWRLVGEAADVPLAAGTAVTGVFIVPTTGHLPLISAGYPAALRAVSVAFVLWAYAYAARAPEVRSDLRPRRWLAPAFILPPLTSALVVAPPVRWSLSAQFGPVAGLAGAEAVGCAAVLFVGLVRPMRPRRALATSTVPLMVSLAGASAGLASTGLASTGLASTGLASTGLASARVPGTTAAGAVALVAVLFLLTGAISGVVSAGASVQSAFRRVVLYDLRGRRRWEAAEEQLERARHAYQGQRHDINSMLSAMDGTLLVLSGQRDALPASQVDNLVRAVREEVGTLRSLLSEPDRAPGAYDLSGLLGAIVSVRSTAGHIKADVQPGLVVEGRPDRLAVVVDNLLANAAAHGEGYAVGIVARLLGVGGAETVQIRVSDRGPGLDPDEIGRAFERGWRSHRSSQVAGSGLGLYQCRQMVEAEGGSIELQPTRTGTRAGRRGLTAVVTVPVRKTTASL